MVRRVRKKNGYIYGVVSSDLGEVGFVLDGGLLSFFFVWCVDDADTERAETYAEYAL